MKSISPLLKSVLRDCSVARIFSAVIIGRFTRTKNSISPLEIMIVFTQLNLLSSFESFRGLFLPLIIVESWPTFHCCPASPSIFYRSNFTLTCYYFSKTRGGMRRESGRFIISEYRVLRWVNNSLDLFLSREQTRVEHERARNKTCFNNLFTFSISSNFFFFESFSIITSDSRFLDLIQLLSNQLDIKALYRVRWLVGCLKFSLNYLRFKRLHVGVFKSYG